MIKLSRKYVKLQLELPIDVSKEEVIEIPEGKYSFYELVTLIENTNLYLKNKRNRSRPSHKKQRILEKNLFACVECGATKNLELDHIIPVSQGGSDDDDNLQILCSVCHHRKHKTHAK